MKLTYRPEIDGLRAVAVLAVVLNHANSNWLASGFLGVDIFFVISGYLITQIIYREMQNNEFSFLNFYKRRIKRILPAFLVVLFFTTLSTYFLFLPEDFFEYNKSAFASLLFSANLWFSRSINYFDPGAHEKPLLHIWSLSVEEQFYFVFPIVLLLAFKYFKNKIPVFILGLIAFSLALHFAPTFGLQAHYLPHLRAYELLIGAFFAIIPARPVKFSSFSLGSAFLLIFAMLVIQKNSISPNGVAEKLIICWATGWILFQQNTNSLVHKILSQRYLVWFGLISYSLYLWHWVILAQIRYVLMDDKIPTGIAVLAIFVSIGLAYLSYRFVEQPCRKIKNFSTKKLVFSLSFYFSLAVISILFYKNNKIEMINNHNNYDWEDNVCHDKINFPFCTKGDLTKEPKILVIGDSHAGQYNRFFDNVGKYEGWSADVISSSSCSYIHDSDGFFINKNQNNRINCSALHKYVNDNLEKYEKIIIIQGFFIYFDIHSNYLEEFKKSLSKLSKEKEIYIFEDNPHINTPHVNSIGPNRLNLFSPYVPYVQFKYINQDKYNQQIKDIVKEFPNVNWIDTNYLLPSDGKINDIYIYRDYNHFNPYGAEKLAERFIENGMRLIKE